MCNEKQPKSSLSLNGGMQNDGKDVKLKNSLLNPKLQSNNLNPPAVEEDALKNTKGITNNDNASSTPSVDQIQNDTNAKTEAHAPQQELMESSMNATAATKSTKTTPSSSLPSIKPALISSKITHPVTTSLAPVKVGTTTVIGVSVVPTQNPYTTSITNGAAATTLKKPLIMHPLGPVMPQSADSSIKTGAGTGELVAGGEVRNNGQTPSSSATELKTNAVKNDGTTLFSNTLINGKSNSSTAISTQTINENKKINKNIVHMSEKNYAASGNERNKTDDSQCSQTQIEKAEVNANSATISQQYLSTMTAETISNVKGNVIGNKTQKFSLQSSIGNNNGTKVLDMNNLSPTSKITQQDQKQQQEQSIPQPQAAQAQPIPSNLIPHPLINTDMKKIISDILMLLQTYGALSAHQIEYNLPPYPSLDNPTLSTIQTLETFTSPPTPESLPSSFTEYRFKIIQDVLDVLSVLQVIHKTNISKDVESSSISASSSAKTKTGEKPNMPSISEITRINGGDGSKTIPSDEKNDDNNQKVDKSQAADEKDKQSNNKNLQQQQPQKQQEEKIVYFFNNGKVRGDVIYPWEIMDMIEDANQEINESLDRIKMLKKELGIVGGDLDKDAPVIAKKEQTPVRSGRKRKMDKVAAVAETNKAPTITPFIASSIPPSQRIKTTREFLKVVLHKYPDLVYDPVYNAALRNFNVDLGAVARERERFNNLGQVGGVSTPSRRGSSSSSKPNGESSSRKVAHGSSVKRRQSSSGQGGPSQKKKRKKNVPKAVDKSSSLPSGMNGDHGQARGKASSKQHQTSSQKQSTENNAKPMAAQKISTNDAQQGKTTSKELQPTGSGSTEKKGSTILNFATESKAPTIKDASTVNPKKSSTVVMDKKVPDANASDKIGQKQEQLTDETKPQASNQNN